MISNWLRTHRKKVAVHGIILCIFILYLVFLADPLFNRYEAIPGESKPLHVTLPVETGGIRYWIDLFDVRNRHIEVMGWAFIHGYSSNNTTVYVILKSRQDTYAFKTVSQLKPQITEVYKDLGVDLDWSGFHCIIPLRKIEPGEYTAGLYITKGDIQALQYTNQTFVR